MAADHELITRTVRDCLEGWYDAAVARMARIPHPGVLRTGGGRMIADALWLPR